MIRIIALLIIAIPGFIAMYGIKLMRDAMFSILNPPLPSISTQFLLGFVMFCGGLYFVSGFIFRRDKKRNKVQTKFQKDKQ